MKITHIEAIPVRVPRPQSFKSSLGVQLASENAVVRVYTDEGLIGIGEASSIWERRGSGESETINRFLSEKLIGKDPTRINDISALMNKYLHRSFPAKAGIEMALYDILGKSLNSPVYNILGGLVR